MRVASIFVIALLFASVHEAAAQQPAGFKVIVHSSNSTGSMSRAELAHIFMKKKTHWASGAVIMPIDLVDEGGARQEFSKFVLNKNVSSVKSFWQQQIFSGRDVPPMEKRTDDEVVAFVKANPNAIGYVSGGARPTGVRTVNLTD